MYHPSPRKRTVNGIKTKAYTRGFILKILSIMGRGFVFIVAICPPTHHLIGPDFEK